MSLFLTILAILAAVIIAAIVIVLRVTPGRRHPHRRSRADRLADLDAEDADDLEHWRRVRETIPENSTDYKPKESA